MSARRLSSRVVIVSNRFCNNGNAAAERLIASADIAACRASVLSWLLRTISVKSVFFAVVSRSVAEPVDRARAHRLVDGPANHFDQHRIDARIVVQRDRERCAFGESIHFRRGRIDDRLQIVQALFVLMCPAQ